MSSPASEPLEVRSRDEFVVVDPFWPSGRPHEESDMTNAEQQIATSVLVIGTGGSGLRAAIELAERGIDERLNVNLVWSGPGRIEREAIPGIPVDISARMRDVSSDGKLVE
jgi:NADPH-dependent 2,4-dienoyl-CoA reductase/sulfur reductase-like enzyme